jgi:hypothetical protein
MLATLENIYCAALLPLTFICPLTSPLGWSMDGILTYVFSQAIDFRRSFSVFPEILSLDDDSIF